MENIQQLLQVSAKLYQHLAVLPEEELRDTYIEKTNILLDERGIIMGKMQQDGFKVDMQQKSHAMLAELDKGIRERLNKVMKVVQTDLKDLQNAKKHEQQYMNPYANVQVMDGRYYDKKN
ncbi:flagellar protein FliT [Solibacillus sp. FSL W8-0372]|uniref:flagellar protein FliT n=1 Tax=Solibacillus sp. FSL W8-0372 TaxID=2921713 RepID=UPI0030CA67FA